MFVPLGPWSSSEPYLAYDMVLYNNSSYLALANNTNVEPDSNESVWYLFAQAPQLSIYNSSGLVTNPKVWVGQVTSNSSGTFSADISSASFSTIMSAVCTVLNSSTNPSNGDTVWINTITASTITGSLSRVDVSETSPQTINLIVYGI